MARQKERTERDTPLLMTVEQTAAYLGRSVHRVYEGARRGFIPARKHGTRVLFSRPELDRWLAGTQANGDRAALASGDERR